MFDIGAAAVPLEGKGGNGDSGSPVLVDVSGQWQLSGLASWKYQANAGKAADTRAGVYGQTSKSVRISHYAEWIGSVLASDTNHANELNAFCDQRHVAVMLHLVNTRLTSPLLLRRPTRRLTVKWTRPA